MPLTSTFSADSLEREYQAELGPEKARLTRIVAALGIALILIYMVLDLWAIPSSLLTVWSFRAAMVVALALTFLSTRLPSFESRYPWIIAAAFAVMGAGVNGMIWIAQPGDVAIDVYQGGLVLVIMGVYTLTYVHVVLTTAIAVAITAGYAAITLLVHDYRQDAKLIVLAGNLFMFGSIIVIGITAQALRDAYSRENYLLRHSLKRDVEIKEEEKRRASWLAEHDPLTGAANRLRFEKDAAAMIDRARGADLMVQILFLDLDGFKPVNDVHGHAVGDRVLRVVAERLRQCVKPGDAVARVGGDEFVVALLTPLDDPAAGAAAAERIAGAVTRGIELRGTTLRLSASIGVAAFPADGDDLEAVMRAADAQMYVVKKRGKSGIALTPGCKPTRVAG